MSNGATTEMRTFTAPSDSDSDPSASDLDMQHFLSPPRIRDGDVDGVDGDATPDIPSAALLARTDLDSDVDDLDDGVTSPSLSRSDDRPDWASLLPLYFMQFCEQWNSDSLFSFIAWLVIDFSPGLSQDEVGRWAGFIASTYFIGQFLSSYFWGFLADRYGKKMLLLCGGIGTLVSIVAFGFSRSLLWSVVARSLCGILNGNIGIVKSFIGEVTNSKTQAQSFGYLGVAWGLGSICGSVVGGVLARPAKKWDFFVGTAFDTFPYLLTNVVNAAIMLIGVIATAVFLKDPVRRPLALPMANVSDVGDSPVSAPTKPRSCAKLRGFFWVFGQAQIMLPVMAYVMVGGINTFVKESLPLFLVATPQSGGLNFGTIKTGALLGVSGFTSIVFALFIYKPIANRFGLIRTFRGGLLLVALMNAMFPFCGLLYWPDSPNVFMWMLLVVVYCFQTCANQCAFSSVFVLISNSTYREKMGQVNGVSQSFVALMRAVAPIAAGQLFAWSVAVVRPWPINIWFNFLLQALVHCVIFSLSLFFSAALDRPKEEQ